jgi:hypothetical protein
MAGDRVNNYSQVDSNILELQLTADKTFKGYHHLTLTNYDNTTVPAIAAGSAIECNGALYKFDTEEAISTTDPVTSATVADGTVYVCIIPGATTCTAAFTATAPTWSDSKQGWYGTGGQANYRYASFCIIKATSSYSKFMLNKSMRKKTCLITNLSGDQSVSSTSAKIIFNVKSYDINSEFNTSTGVFTASQSGFYLIGGNIALNNFSSSYVSGVQIYKNGVLVQDKASTPGGIICINTFICSLYLNKDDYIELYVISHDVSESSFLINHTHSEMFIISM